MKKFTRKACIKLKSSMLGYWLSRIHVGLLDLHYFVLDQQNTVTFRPGSTSVAGTVSNAEGFACCCRAANDENGYRVGTGQWFELTAVDVGHLGRSATWR